MNKSLISCKVLSNRVLVKLSGIRFIYYQNYVLATSDFAKDKHINKVIRFDHVVIFSLPFLAVLVK